MNGDTAPQTNKGIITIVILTLALNATIGLSTLAYCLIAKIEPNQVLLTAFISIITGLLGIIGGMLSKTSPTEATKQTPTETVRQPPHPPVPSGDAPTQVTVMNTPDAPVPTTEEPK